MGLLETRSFVEPDLASVGDPVDSSRRVIVEEHASLERDSSREFEWSCVQHDEVDVVRQADLPGIR